MFFEKCIKGFDSSTAPEKNSKAFMNFKQVVPKEFSGNIALQAIYMQMYDRGVHRGGGLNELTLVH